MSHTIPPKTLSISHLPGTKSKKPDVSPPALIKSSLQQVATALNKKTPTSEILADLEKTCEKLPQGFVQTLNALLPEVRDKYFEAILNSKT